MKSTTSIICFLLLAHFAKVFATASSNHDNLRRRLGDTFCWKDTEDRGAGTIPTECPEGNVELGLLCYKPCPFGYSRSGVDCHQNCPNGFTDTGLFCRLDASDYGRGEGYPWKFGDPLNSSGQFHRCEQDHGEGNCEEWGAVVYPKCKSGFRNDECCLCVPDAPDCSALGLGGSTAQQSCAKKVVLGKETIKNRCPSGKKDQAGLCYKKCKSGYHGVGPVCWSNSPSGWVDCGAGDARSSLDCASSTTSQITSVVDSAVKIATLVVPGAEEADAAEDAATDAGAIAEDAGDFTGDLKSFKKLLAAFKLYLTESPHAKKAIDDGEAGDITPESLLAAAGLTKPADIIRFAASIANFFDPTGLSGVVAAYSYPLCSDVSSH